MQLKNSDEYYVVDLSGAQYGFFEPVTPAHDYETSKVEGHIPPFRDENLGATKSGMLDSSMGVGPVGLMISLMGEDGTNLHAATCKINNKTSINLLKGAKDWEQASQLRIAKLLRLKDKEFKDRRQQLLANIQRCVGNCVSGLKMQAAESKAKIAA